MTFPTSKMYSQSNHHQSFVGQTDWAFLLSDFNKQGAGEEEFSLIEMTVEDVEVIFKEQEAGYSVQPLNTENKKQEETSDAVPITEKIQRVSDEVTQNSSKKTIKSLKHHKTHKNFWTKEQDDFLLGLTKSKAEKWLDWKQITARINQRFDRQLMTKACRERFTRQLDPTLIRSPFTLEGVKQVTELLKTRKYFKGGDIESITYRGIYYSGLARDLNRPDHLVRGEILLGQMSENDPYLKRVRAVEKNRIHKLRLKASLEGDGSKKPRGRCIKV